MSTNKAWLEEVTIAFNTLEQTKNDIMNTYSMFAWNQDKMSAAEIKLFQNFEVELTKLIQWVNEYRVRRLKLDVSCFTYANLKEKFKVLLLEADRDLETIDFGEKENNYHWRNSMEQFMIDDRKYLIRDFAILIQRLENLQAEFLEKYAAIHEEAIAIAEKSVVAEEEEEVEAVVVEEETVERGSANTVRTDTKAGIGIRINMTNTIARVTKNNKVNVKKEQPVSIGNRIKNTIQKVCAVVKNTVKSVKNTVADMIARLKFTIAAIVA